MTESKFLPKVLAVIMVALTALTTLMIPVSASTSGGSGSSTIYVEYQGKLLVSGSKFCYTYTIKTDNDLQSFNKF